MRLSIKRNSRYLIEFDQIQIAGKQGLGGFVITVGLQGSRNSCEKPIAIVDISLSLSTEGGAMPIALSVPSSTQIIRCHEGAYRDGIYFEVFLTKEQILAIEEYRGSGDLSLRFSLRAMTICEDNILPSFEISGCSVSRQEWLNALKCAGFQETFLLEIPVPEVSEEIRQLIFRGQEFIDHGHYKEAVGLCRKIIEALEVIRGDKEAAKQAGRKLTESGERKSMTIVERMLAMREQLNNICHLGVHGDEPFSRSQARAVLSVTLSLLAEPTVGFIDADLVSRLRGDGANI